MPHHDLLISGGHVVTLDPEIGDLPQLLASLTVDSRASLIRKSEHLSYGLVLGPRAEHDEVSR